VLMFVSSRFLVLSSLSERERRLTTEILKGRPIPKVGFEDWVDVPIWDLDVEEFPCVFVDKFLYGLITNLKPYAPQWS